MWEEILMPGNGLGYKERIKKTKFIYDVEHNIE